MTIRSIGILVLAVLLASCGTTIPYSSGVPMSRDAFSTRDGSLTGLIPEGWFSSVDDTLAPALSAWLTRNDFGATITLRKITLDTRTTGRITQSGLKPLLAAEAGFLGESAVRLSEPVEYEHRGTNFCAAEFTTDQGPTRIVVFGMKGAFYECRASKTKGEWSGGDFQKLFTVQQSVLSTLQQ